MGLDWPPQFDPAVKAKAVEVARSFINPERAGWIRQEFAKHPAYIGTCFPLWILSETEPMLFGFLRLLRRELIKSGITNDQTPSGSWEFHTNELAEIAELAVGIHRLPRNADGE
jgi:hypothetical protein